MQSATAAPVRRQRAWWWADALLWTLAAGIVAPTVFTLSIIAVAMIRGAGPSAFTAVFFMGGVAFARTFEYALLPYGVLLLAWAAVAPYVGVGERSRVQIVGLCAVLALAAGVGAFARDGEAEWELGAWVWGAAWIGLAVPRLVLRRLGSGAFGRSGLGADAA